MVRKFRLKVRALYSPSHQRAPAPTILASPSLQNRLFHFGLVRDEDAAGEPAGEAACLRQKLRKVVRGECGYCRVVIECDQRVMGYRTREDAVERSKDEHKEVIRLG